MNGYVKRACDVLLSSLALLVLSPLLVPLAVILKLTGEHYIFYKQDRIGRGGKPFEVLKFATMLRDSPNMMGGDITVHNDPRILPFGRILRKTKINELPQLINVLKGDMSLIGPRPLTARVIGHYSEDVKATISRLKPGLSGIGSLVFHNEETVIAASGIPREQFWRHHMGPYKGELERWYVEHQSATLDLVLMLLTIWVVLAPESKLHFRLFRDLPKPASPLLARCLALPLIGGKKVPAFVQLPAHEMSGRGGAM